jgi:lysophospholipase L1-like esterase
MNKIKFVFNLLLLLCISNAIYSQATNAFQTDINAFKKIDSLQPPPKNPILFVGSSSFTRWKSINNDLPGYPIINRGFGGSSLPDVIQYAQETIFKYHPKQIYIYCGENDLAMNAAITPENVLERYQTLHSMIRKELGKKIAIVFISLKPSIARWKLESKYIETNQLIKNFLAKDKHARYLDVHAAMLDEHQEVLKNIFVEDNLHMNAKGYAIWIKVIAPTLLK